MKLLSIEGPPSVFKSYILNILKEKYRDHGESMLIIDEPVDMFCKVQDVKGNNLGNPFVEFHNGMLSASTVQHHIINCLEQKYLDKLKKLSVKTKLVLSERSIISCKAFICMYLSEEKLSRIEATVLLNRIHLCLNNLHLSKVPHTMILLNQPEDINRKLIINRNREGEIDIVTKKYIRAINELYKTCFKDIIIETNDIKQICGIINNELDLTDSQIGKLHEVKDNREQIIIDCKKSHCI